MSYRVLIVDDQREVSRLLRSALETIEQGLEVFEAPSGEEALLEASANKFDLLVADYRLPGISGVELMNKIRSRDPHAKSIIISGVADPKVKDEIAKSGADAHFRKPVPMADFLDAVERLLGMERTILPAEKEERAEKRKTLADLLVNFRKELKADAVILFNDRGRVTVQAGELPDPSMQVSLTSALMAVFSAAQKASILIGPPVMTDVHLFHSEKADMVFVPVGPLHALLVTGKGLASADKLEKTIKTLSKVQVDVENVLKVMGVTGPLILETEQESGESKAKAPVESEQDGKNFEDILETAAKESGVDVDAFWSAAAEKGATFVLKDTLTFEEAKKLGLAPDSAK
jgi:CheY-like chemotaxis protein